jgi:hypothetical protein
MRIRGGGGRAATVETAWKRRERRPAVRVDPFSRDEFEVGSVRAVRAPVGTIEVTRELAAQGRARVEQDEGRGQEQLMELGRLMGGLTAELVVELINHFVQRPKAARSAAMVVVGALTSALFVEFWALGSSDEASVLERFVDFIEATEGQPERRLAGTLYSVESS